jgi:hypothetical protein
VKPCEARYEHIDQEEFGDGRKITTSLLTRFCNNIQGLWNKTSELGDNTDPELRKRFTPPIIHDIHSHGITLNQNNEYQFDNSTETTFLDALGLKTIEIKNLQKTGTNNQIYTKKLETTHNIHKISINKTKNEYPIKNSIDTLNNEGHGYYIDTNENILYIKLSQGEILTRVLATVHSDDPFIDRKNTTAHVDLTGNKIHAPYSPEQYENEILDQNTAIQKIYYTTYSQISNLSM